jgi:hypothetical protein
VFEIVTLTLSNVGALAGEQEIRFATSADSDEVTIISAGNGLGKTTIAQALLVALGFDSRAFKVRSTLGAVSPGRIELHARAASGRSISHTVNLFEEDRHIPEDFQGLKCLWGDLLDPDAICAVSGDAAEEPEWTRMSDEATQVFLRASAKAAWGTKNLTILVHPVGIHVVAEDGSEITDGFAIGETTFFRLCSLIGRLRAGPDRALVILDGFFSRLDRERARLSLELLANEPRIGQILLLATDQELAMLGPSQASLNAVRYQLLMGRAPGNTSYVRAL